MDDKIIKYKSGFTGSVASESARGAFEYIRDDIQDIKKRYITLGFHLVEFDRNEYYKEFGYSSLADFVQVNFGIEHTQMSRIISVFLRFSEVENNVHKMWINDKYSDFSFGQLVEMASLSPQQIDKDISPSMSIKAIRDYKRNGCNKKLCDVAQNKKVEKKVLTKQEKCDTAPLPELDMQRPFDERYQLLTGNDLFVNLMDCLKDNIRNVDKTAAIIKLLNDSGL